MFKIQIKFSIYCAGLSTDEILLFTNSGHRPFTGYGNDLGSAFLLFENANCINYADCTLVDIDVIATQLDSFDLDRNAIVINFTRGADIKEKRQVRDNELAGHSVVNQVFACSIKLLEIEGSCLHMEAGGR